MVMDISQKYVDMCVKAIEVQKSWNHEVGDIAHTKWKHIDGSEKEDVTALQSCHCYEPIDFYNETSIWLPRQDQLQAMIKKEKLDYLLVDFKAFVWRNQAYIVDATMDYPLNICDTMEQLWLCFVMNYNYNKRWNGEDWVGE